MLTTNHPPQVRNTDKGIWRRLKLIPFSHTIPDAERDINFKEEKLRPELEGILAWAVEGALEWNQDGLAEPQVVREASQEYRKEMDLIGRFLEEECVVDPQAMVRVSDLYQLYEGWCIQNRVHKDEIKNPNSFSRELTKRGFRDYKSNSARYRIGLHLRSERPENVLKAPSQESEGL